MSLFDVGRKVGRLAGQSDEKYLECEASRERVSEVIACAVCRLYADRRRDWLRITPFSRF